MTPFILLPSPSKVNVPSQLTHDRQNYSFVVMVVRKAQNYAPLIAPYLSLSRYLGSVSNLRRSSLLTTYTLMSYESRISVGNTDSAGFTLDTRRVNPYAVKHDRRHPKGDRKSAHALSPLKEQGEIYLGLVFGSRPISSGKPSLKATPCP